jgi:hypothetical protein
MPAQKRQFTQDVCLVILSIFVAILIAQSGAINHLVASLDGFVYLGIFVAGIFFTSVFTTPLAIVALGELAMHNNILLVSVLGGLGAASGDYAMFRFFKDRVSEDFGYLLTLSKIKRLPHIFRTEAFKWFAPFLGAVIIASPLPDEIGVAILSLSKLDERVFLPISFFANSFGILVIGLIATKLLG